jgi:hypothetical protein
MKAVIKMFEMFSQTIVKFFLRQFFFLSVCILITKTQEMIFCVKSPISEFLVHK